jgi:glycosyltransferase involved in cell wall biosynthesis
MANAVLIISNFISRHGAVRTVAEELAVRFSATGRQILTSSHCVCRTVRFLDMTATTWLHRKEFDVAIVEVYSNAAFIWAESVCWVLRQARKPYILSAHGGQLPSFAIRWPNRVRRLFTSATIVTVPSHYLFEELRHYRADLRLLPNALDVGNYSVRMRQQVCPRLIWLRAFHKLYNPILAVRVFHIVIQAWPEAHLTMIGPDKGDGTLQEVLRLADELGVSQRISLPGKVSKDAVSDWMNRGDIFLNTTNADNAPISVLEAMACGLCVVSTNPGGIPYLLADGQDALLVPPRDPNAMAQAIHRLLLDPKLAMRISRNARIKAERFDWSIILPQWESILEAISGRSELGGMSVAKDIPTPVA